MKTGLYFKSNIPTGYGAGSSGALCAAVFHRYLRIGPKLSLSELRASLGAVESFFHGSSSGTDPLICYLDEAILINAGGAIETVRLPKPPAHFFVIDTGIERQTGPWVKAFLEKSKEKDFLSVLQQELIPASDLAIQALMNHRADDLWSAMTVISNVHFRQIPSFIPTTFHDLWQSSLDSDDYKLKICGAGGGGFILGVARSVDVIEQLKKRYPIYLLEW